MGINILIYSIGLCGKKIPTCYINVNKVNFLQKKINYYYFMYITSLKPQLINSLINKTK